MRRMMLAFILAAAAVAVAWRRRVGLRSLRREARAAAAAAQEIGDAAHASLLAEGASVELEEVLRAAREATRAELELATAIRAARAAGWAGVA